MSGDIKLSIQSPCGENWDHFDKRKEGSYCHSCQKVVTDFTTKTDKEIYDYLKSASGNLCGRFRSTQLKNYQSYEYPIIRSKYHLFKAGIITIAMLLFSNRDAKSQAPADRTQQEQLENKILKVENKKLLSTGITVRGTVTYEGEPMPGVNIVVDKKDLSAIADLDGEFELSDLEAGDVIKFFFIGFETMEYVVLPNSSTTVANIQLAEIKFTECEMVFMGELNIVEIYNPKPTPIKTFLSKIASIF